jgi:regulator of sigma E protease
MTVLTVIAGILVILILATVHEFGHFLAAKASGIAVDEFSVGFGPAIYKKEIKGTLYKICALPILGYVRIRGQEGDFDAPDGYFKKSLWSRFITIFSGPLMNFIIAIIIFAFVFSFFGNPFLQTTTVSSVMQGSPAMTAGFEKNDKIIAIDGAQISTWDDITKAVQGSNGKTLIVTVERSGKQVSLSVIPEKDKVSGEWMIGIYSSAQREPFFKSIYEGAKWTGDLLYRMFVLIPMLFTRQGLGSLVGPIGIVAMTSQAASGGFANLLWFSAFISIALGFTNLLPIPALDGSWIVLIIWEAITRRPIPPKRQATVMGIGFIFVLGLMVLVSLRDILRLIK